MPQSASPNTLARRRDQVAAAVGVPDAGCFPVVELPHNTRPLGALPEDRKSALAEHVRTLAREVRNEQPGEVRLWPRSQARLPLDGKPCELCQGACCNDGGDTAFLAHATLREYFRVHPAAGVGEAVADYTSCLPRQSYVGSCVFHAAQGCALPRDMRSDICNRHLCASLLDAEGLPRAFAVAVDDAGQVRGEELIDTDDR